MATTKPGERLLANSIDYYAANDPSRVWASVASDKEQSTGGFKNITSADLAIAINHAAWWLTKNICTNGTAFETIAYAGPKDARYPIIALAAVKSRKRVSQSSLEIW